MEPQPSVDAIFLIEDGRIVDCNPGRPELFGCPREQAIAELEALLAQSGALRGETSPAGEEVTFDWPSQRPDGTRFTVACTLTRVAMDGQFRVFATAVDITARRESERRLAQLSGRLLQLQDEERRRIARELHDSTGQNLGALSMNLSSILTHAPLDQRAADVLQESIELANLCLREIRTMSYLLHPPLLDELGLVSALRAYADGYSDRTGIRLHLDLPRALPRLPEPIEMAVFRVVQEGLANIHRHSGSQTAVLRLRYARQTVEIKVVDQGRGIPAGVLEQGPVPASRIGVGIAGMRERARQLGGQLTIASGENGTVLHLVLPLAGGAEVTSATT